MKPMPFSVVLGLIAMGSFLFVLLYFHFSHNTAFKRKVWPFFVVIFLSTMVISFISSMARTGKWRWDILGFLIPGVAILGFVMIRRTRFCDCGRTCYQQPIFSQPSFCPYCGKQIQ
jgi:drug/metabolite transporter (DMT)-like permease